MRQKFGNFVILSLLGQGGMGSVFRALDTNLNREIALKILRPELGSDQEEKEKLAEEARRSAKINHPHVVKVFSFGESEGQFYLAMELVEKGSLDDLMELQGKVPEMQVLDVGIQIASGLQAALVEGLIHRDIKPGNILFADAHRAKLVDFGLARVMDEVAAEKGEIWGTPYYVAPEKLDGGEEDFRSDMYSLGGTMFHALAGRPPYEAETASMVALKQLKSQAVSLHSFAPEISAETNYVVNRMMAKNAEERYPTYEELISHLNYAKEKLLERVGNHETVNRKKLVLESRQQKIATGAISLVLLLVFLGLLVTGYVQRERVAELLGIPTSSEQGWTQSTIRESLAKAGKEASDGNPAAALSEVTPAATAEDSPQPAKSEAQMVLVASLLLNGRQQEAGKLAKQIESRGLYSESPEDLRLANFFLRTARFAARTAPVPLGNAEAFDPQTLEAFAALLFALHNASQGDLDTSRTLLRKFSSARPEGAAGWVTSWQPLAPLLLQDLETLANLDKEIRVSDGPGSGALIPKIKPTFEKLRFAPLFTPLQQKWETDLRKKVSAESKG